jgi:hypothetical protein
MRRAQEAGTFIAIERMIKLSEADLHMNSQVVGISPSHHRRYRLSIVRDPHIPVGEFDAVILATPP